MHRQVSVGALEPRLFLRGEGPDPSFGAGGVTVNDFTSGPDAFEDVLVQPDGSVVAVGGTGTDFLVARYSAGGVLDTSFGSGGRAVTDFPADPLLVGGRQGTDRAFAAALQPDGKLLVVGYHVDGQYGSAEDWAITRYNPDGSPDATLAGGGRFIFNINAQMRVSGFRERAYDVIPAPGGGFFVAGEGNSNTSTPGAVVRFNADGSPDGTFRVQGNNYQAVALQPDGKIVAARGETGRITVARFLPGGARDVGFGGGLAEVQVGGVGPRASDVVVAPDGRVLVGGTTDGDFLVVAFQPSGLQARFETPGGVVQTDMGGGDEGKSLRLLPGGGMMLAGPALSGNGVGVARYHPNGTLDAAFGFLGKLTLYPAPQTSKTFLTARFAPDGKVVAAGQGFRGSGEGPALVARLLVEPAPPAAVVGRHVFYNNSLFDGGDSAADSADDRAIAPDKLALTDAQPASFANITSYSRGINGLMVDVAGLPPDVTPTAEEFDFAHGRRGHGASAATAPPPAQVAVRRGAGVGGSDRVTIAWGADAVRNTWLKVTVKATDRTWLAAPDVFYFGNLVGETGSGGALGVSSHDVLATRAGRSAGAAPLCNRFDHNRDGVVNVLDYAAAVRARGQTLDWAAPPQAIPPGGAAHPLRDRTEPTRRTVLTTAAAPR